jgi:hypothetical protein
LGTRALVGATNTFLQIPRLSLSDAGVYRVVISNEFGAITNEVATLSVTSGPWLEYTAGWEGKEWSYGVFGQTGEGMVLEATSDWEEWTPVYTNQTPEATFEYREVFPDLIPQRFYRSKNYP